jgi:hypothetical protein
MSCVMLQGMKNPLDNVSQVTPKHNKPEDKAHKSVTGMYQYFLKVCSLAKLHLLWASTCSAAAAGHITQQQARYVLCCPMACREAGRRDPGSQQHPCCVLAELQLCWRLAAVCIADPCLMCSCCRWSLPSTLI